MYKRNEGGILFIGNGLNRVSNNGTAWSTLLDKLAGKPKTKHEEKIRREKPFTLWFEELCNHIGKKNIKQSFSEEICRNLTPGQLHEQVMSLGMQHILTTNYDYNLEHSSQEKWSSGSTAQEAAYSLFRRTSVGSKYVWHIHGELNNTRSIMLGHDQYTGYQHKIQNFLQRGVSTESKERNRRPYLSKFSKSKKRYKGDVESWVDLFIERDVHMVGFGLDYTENHLWNLISVKNKLRKKSKMPIGKMKFYRCSKNVLSIADEARISILESMGVEIYDYQRGSYKEAYEDCIEALRNQ